MNPEEFFENLARPDYRVASFDDVEIKDGGNVFLFDGYSTVFGQPAEFETFVEEVQQGAFRSVLASGANVPMLHEHKEHEMLATTKSGRLKLSEDAHGLRVQAKLAKNDLSTRVKSLVDSGDITGMSTGFVVGSKTNQQISYSGSKPHRLITGFKRLLDVSTTWNPAFTTTQANFRSLATVYADSPESWQRILTGAYPQLEELGDDNQAGTDDETVEARTDTVATTGVEEDADLRRLETAKRRMAFITLTTGGGHDAS